MKWFLVIAFVCFVDSSPQVPDIINYAGLCRWACDDGEIRTAVGWEEGALEVVLARPVDLDPATGLPRRDPVTGAWAGAMELRRAPRDAASADIHDCVTYSGPSEPFIRNNPTCECCLGFDLDGDRDVDLVDLVAWQRRTVPR